MLMPARHIKQHRAQVLPAVNKVWQSRNCGLVPAGLLVLGTSPSWVNYLRHMVGYDGVSTSETPRIIGSTAKPTLAGRDWVKVPGGVASQHDAIPQVKPEKAAAVLGPP